MKRRTKFVIVSIINIELYTAATMLLTWHDKTVPSDLTVSFFAAWTVELAILAGIKKNDKDEH